MATAVLSAVLASSATAQAPSAEVCGLAAKRGGLTSYADYGVETPEGARRIENVRISGGSKNDELLWFCPGSGSIIPADPCTLKLTLASSGESHTLEEQRLHVIRYKGSLFVVTGWRESETAPAHTDVYAISPAGFGKLCQLVERPNSRLEDDAIVTALRASARAPQPER
jgi:hypothetical protein